jgi:hypothetical protein
MRGGERVPPSVGEVDAAVLAARVDRLVAHAEAALGIAERRWLVQALESALLRSDPGAHGVDLLNRAVAVGAVSTFGAVDGNPPPHSVVVPLAAGLLGFARRVHAGFDLDAGDAAESLAGDARCAVRAALDAAARRAPPPHEPARYRLAAWLPGALEHVLVEGESLGAAMLVSAVALWSGRAVVPGTSVSASLSGSGLACVGGLDSKIEALAARADVVRLVVAQPDEPLARSLVAARRARLEIVGVADVDALLAAALEPVSRTAAPVDIDYVVQDARRAFAGGWSAYAWPALRELLERVAAAIPPGRPDLEVAALTMLGAARRHLGAPEESARVLARAEALAETRHDVLPDAPLVHLLEHVALTSVALGDLVRAMSAARRAVRTAAHARSSGELLKALGTLGLVELARGKPLAAADAQARALDLVHVHRPQSCVRTHAYLAEARGAAGDLPGARAAFEDGLAHLGTLPSAAARDDVQAWLRTSYGSALVACGALDEAVVALDVPAVRARLEGDPLPGLLARRHLGRALAGASRSRPDERERGLELLAQSPAAHHHLGAPRFLAIAHVNVLYEARARLAHGRWDADVQARALRALGYLPRYGRIPALLDPLAVRVERGLGDARRRPETLGRALDALLARASRLGV